MRILNIVGARPNFVKMAPIVRALAARPKQFEHRLVHTGQHYDDKMSDIFFHDLGLPKPDVNLEVGSGSHARQTADVMVRLEPILQDFRPDLIVVVGDVNSTVASALTAKKLGIGVAHVEAGLRSFDMTMPEEINRLCTDAISDLLFTTDRFANENLAREGVAAEKIHFVGNVMIDSLLACRDLAARQRVHEHLQLQPESYATLTLHRPANVETAGSLTEILSAISDSLPDLPIVFPVHPRTRQRIIDFGLGRFFVDHPGKRGIWMTEPLGYLEFLSLNTYAKIALTDSGGVQEETTVLGIPCVTLRDNTERPITVTEGTNQLGGTKRATITAAIGKALAERPSDRRTPERWDGGAATRIAEVLGRWEPARLGPP
jgi:UDP-N-acetylglucosamine 2-epimerase (non-hydrolysing)